MNITTTGRKTTLDKSFLDLVEKRMAKFDKYFESDAEAVITVTAEGICRKVEITVRNQGFIYRAERTETSMRQAFHDAADLIDKQIIKNKSRLGARIKKQDSEVLAVEADYSGIVDEEYRVVREKRFSLKPMTTEEALLQMNMLNHSFFVFINSDSDIVNIVYRRKDDDFGLLIPDY